MSLSSKPVRVLATTHPFLGRVDAVPSKAEQFANIAARTFWSLPSPWLWCHLSSRLSRLQAALIALPCKPSFPKSTLPSRPPSSAAFPGVSVGFPGCLWGSRCAAAILTGSREAKAGQPASPVPSALLRAPCAFTSSLSSALQRAEIAPKHVLPSGE